MYIRIMRCKLLFQKKKLLGKCTSVSITEEFQFKLLRLHRKLRAVVMSKLLLLRPNLSPKLLLLNVELEKRKLIRMWRRCFEGQERIQVLLRAEYDTS